MSKIYKKTWPELFKDILSGKKNFDLRLNDFEVKEGDVLVLQEWDPELGEYTGREIEKTVKYILKFKNDQLFWPEKDIKEKGLQIMALED